MEQQKKIRDIVFQINICRSNSTKKSSVHVNVFSNKPNDAENHKQNADVAYYGLYDQNKFQY